MIDSLPQDLAPIDSLLRRASREFPYPPTPSIAAQVAARVRQPAATRALPAWRPAFRLAAAALAIALAVTSAAIAVPQSRGALADFFGLSHVRIEVGPVLGPPPPLLHPGNFARPSTVRDAQLKADFPLRFPTSDGVRLEPDAVYLAYGVSTVIFEYRDEGFDLYETRGGIFGKGAPEPGSYVLLGFDDTPAYWFNEGGHIAWFEDGLGRVVIESRRTVERGTLLWERDGMAFRLETSLSKEQAIEVARSLR